MGPAKQGGGLDPEGEDQVVAVRQCKQGNGDQRHKIPADQKSHQKPNKYPEQASLAVTDLQEAELEIVHHCQKRKFPDEIGALQKGKDIKKTSHIYKLNPFLQDGILKVGGRLKMLKEGKHPTILTKTKSDEAYH